MISIELHFFTIVNQINKGDIMNRSLMCVLLLSLSAVSFCMDKDRNSYIDLDGSSSEEEAGCCEQFLEFFFLPSNTSKTDGTGFIFIPTGGGPMPIYVANPNQKTKLVN